MRVVGKTVNERRRDSRPRLPPIRLRFGGQPYKTTEWTLGGFLVNQYIDDHHVGSILTVDIVIDVGKQTLHHQVFAEVARVDTVGRKLAAQFVDLDPEVVDLLDSWLTGRLRRQLARAAKEDAAKEKADARKARQKKRTAR